jgi:hypothetical protein
VKDILDLIESEGSANVVAQFQRIVNVLGSALDVGEIRFKSCVFSAQVNEEIVLILREMDESIKTNYSN